MKNLIDTKVLDGLLHGELDNIIDIYYNESKYKNDEYKKEISTLKDEFIRLMNGFTIYQKI